jgi:uncharacterized protein YyaL (SSP411 family)
VAEGIIEWVNATLSDPQRGGFYASQDADYSLEDDGDYFTWTLAEIRETLSADEAELIAEHLDVHEQGQMHHNAAKNTLCLARPADELAKERSLSAEEVDKRLATARAKLLEARRRRPTPYVDSTLYVGWNGMFISAYLEAARTLTRDDCGQMALRTLERIQQGAWSDVWGFAHRCPEDGVVPGKEWAGGLLDDQVFMAAALLDAFEFTGERVHFDRAERALQLCLEKYWDSENGGFFDRPKDAPPLTNEVQIPRKPFQDSPTPGANSVAAMVLDRLASYTLNDDYRQKARQTLEAFAGAAEQYGLFAATYGLAVMLHGRQPLEVVIVGPGDDSRTQALVRAANGAFRFGKAVLHVEPGQIDAEQLPPGLVATLPHDPAGRVGGGHRQHGQVTPWSPPGLLL